MEEPGSQSPGVQEEPGSPVLTSKKRKHNFDSQSQSKKVKIKKFDDKVLFKSFIYNLYVLFIMFLTFT